MQMQIITHMSTMNSLPTALLSILRLTALPTMPPPRAAPMASGVPDFVSIAPDFSERLLQTF